MITSLVILGVAVVSVLYAVAIYNRLVTFKTRFENAFSQIDTQLMRRYELIPNLVETVKGYLKHERETLDSVTAARNQALSALKAAAKQPGNTRALDSLASAENALGGALGALNIAVEAYPDLKASENVGQLFEELRTTENKIAFARQAFNDEVMNYNTYKQTFPPVLLAGAFGHRDDAALLDFSSDNPQIKEAPKVAL